MLVLPEGNYWADSRLPENRLRDPICAGRTSKLRLFPTKQKQKVTKTTKGQRTLDGAESELQKPPTM